MNCRIHVEDDQLLLYSSGELTGKSAEKISEHLRSCKTCGMRWKRLEAAFREFSEVQRNRLDPALPCATGPRALLKAQLAEAASGKPEGGWFSWPAPRLWRAGAGLAFVALLIVVFARGGHEPVWRQAQLSDEPDARFTPGAVVLATSGQVCSDFSGASASIPADMKTKVLQLYGVPTTQDSAYEVDYLVTPELGGATDVRNLWPEPYDHTVWNAHVKDQLEERLHQMVCGGSLDLATAQRDISTDWIAAYRKYFHADTPVTAQGTS